MLDSVDLLVALLAAAIIQEPPPTVMVTSFLFSLSNIDSFPKKTGPSSPKVSKLLIAISISLDISKIPER